MIHHVQLAAPPKSEEGMRAFWIGVLGFEEIVKPLTLRDRGGCWFRRQDIEVHVGVEDAFRPAQKAHPGFLITDLDECAHRLAAAGYPVAWDADLPGVRRFYSTDPYANRLEFLERTS
jgi:catechol 2,3-dioxygenase-like lactoylglutathione lyase family enzyme